MTINYVGGPLVVLLISWTCTTTALLLILTTTLTPAHSGDYHSDDVNQLSVYISSCINSNKKFIRRWDSERELSLRGHRARTTKYNRLVHKFRHRSTRLCVGPHVFTKFSEI